MRFEYNATQLLLYVRFSGKGEREATAEMQEFSKQTRLECPSNYSENLRFCCHCLVAQTR